jgi:hypothetical protein
MHRNTQESIDMNCLDSSKRGSFGFVAITSSILWALLFLSGIIFAQTDSLPTFYTDSAGRLFVPPGTPVYIYMSTSPDGSNAVRLRSIDPEGDPIAWDGHGPHSLTHLNLYLGRKIRFDLYADGNPPKTVTSFDKTQGLARGNIIYLSGMSLIEISARDPDSGVKSIQYSINGGALTEYRNPISLNQEGEYHIRFFSLDNVGNREDENELVMVVDLTPPVTGIAFEGSKYNDVLSARSAIVLTATDAVGVNSTHYRIDAGNETRYSKPITLAGIAEGEHVLEWYSTDVVGNAETPRTYKFFVDKTPPMVFEEIIGNTYMVAGKEYSSGRSQLKIAAVDNKAGVREVYYSLNNGEFARYERPVYLSDILGAVTIRSYAIDNVGNRSESDTQSEQFAMPTIDITGPIISYDFIGKKLLLRDTLWIGPETRIALRARDNGAGVNRIIFKHTDGPDTEYTEPFSIAKGGYYRVNLTAYDNVDNLNLLSFEVGVDNRPPLIFCHFSAEPYRHIEEDGRRIPVYPLGTKVFLAATDNLSGEVIITFSINNSKPSRYSSVIESLGVNKSYLIRVEAVDALGNRSEKEFAFAIQ